MEMSQPTLPLPPLPPRVQVYKNILLCLVACIVTFGIYTFFWNAHQMRVLNKLLAYEKYNFWKWFVLTIITFGFYHIYYEYVMSKDIVKIQKVHGLNESRDLPIFSVALSILGFFGVADAIQQYELNNLYEKDPRI